MESFDVVGQRHLTPTEKSSTYIAVRRAPARLDPDLNHPVLGRRHRERVLPVDVGRVGDPDGLLARDAPNVTAGDEHAPRQPRVRAPQPHAHLYLDARLDREHGQPQLQRHESVLVGESFHAIPGLCAALSLAVDLPEPRVDDMGAGDPPVLDASDAPKAPHGANGVASTMLG